MKKKELGTFEFELLLLTTSSISLLGLISFSISEDIYFLVPPAFINGSIFVVSFHFFPF